MVEALHMSFLFWLSTIMLNEYCYIFFLLYACDIFYIHYYPLTLFHDTVLLPIVKVCSRCHFHSHFVYLFVIITCFWYIIILVFIDLLVNCYICLTLFSRDSFLRGLEVCYSLYRTFPISNLTFEPIFGFSHLVFSK